MLDAAAFSFIHMSTINTTDVKTAALHAVLTRLKEIDQNDNARSAFIVDRAVNLSIGVNQAMFEPEITLIELALGIAHEDSPTPCEPASTTTTLSEPSTYTSKGLNLDEL